MSNTGLSGNEIYCLNKKGFKAGDLVIGNSVYSMGLLGGLKSGLRAIAGGEITQLTSMISEGRRLALERLQKEVDQRAGMGATGVTNELIFHTNNIEFLSIGSTVHPTDPNIQSKFTSSADGQELYCQIDSGYDPIKFVFGNVAYSIGIGRGLLGGIKMLARGEILEYTNIFNITRNLALERIVNEAKQVGANSVTAIETSILPFGAQGFQEMVMIGTAAKNVSLSNIGAPEIVTSDLTSQELWNMTNMGYVPYKLVLGTSVYSLGVVGSIGSVLKSFTKGEINQLTTLVYDAREKSLEKLSSQSQSIGADEVVGIKTYVYSLGGGVIEFLAIGTAVKYVGDAVKTLSDQLIPQAIITDQDTFINRAELSFGANLNKKTR